jgi:hypothetical protein
MDKDYTHYNIIVRELKSFDVVGYHGFSEAKFPISKNYKRKIKIDIIIKKIPLI